MNDDRFRDGKLEGGEIVRPPREHGKVYRWLDNFWYHHKWKSLIALFLLLVAIVAVVQMCATRKNRTDVGVVLAGPYGFTADEAGLTALTNCLSLYIPEDYDGSGERRVQIVSYTVYSEEEINALAAQGYDKASLQALSADEYASLTRYLLTGETVLLFLSPSLFEEYRPRLVDLSALLETPPAGAVVVDGKTLAVRLGETDLYTQNTALAILPADTLICLLSPVTQSSAKEYEHSVAYLKALVK